MEDQCVITRKITVAAGVFAPGHLGELTRIVPFEMVDESLAATGAVQRRVRLLPARVVVYLLLAGCLFAEVGYRQVWHKLTVGLAGLVVADPCENALWQARVRLGVAPLRWLFDLLRGPAVTRVAAGVRWCGLLVCAIDGTTMAIPDGARNLTAYTKQPGNHGGSGYPLLRLVALVACGTRTVIDAVFGPTSTGENGYTRRLARSLHAGMILLLDRNFDDAALIAALAATEAHLLIRLKGNRKLPVLRRYRDGSFLSQIGATRVRVVECEITIATAAGRHTGFYRLATTLLDEHRYPASALVTLYHQRWEIETAYLEIKSSILGSRVLRARTPAGIAQEVYALLTTYQILRIAVADAIEAAGDVDLTTGQLRVMQTLQRVRGEGIIFGPPKSARSRRALTLPAVAIEALRRHRRLQDADRKEAGRDWQELGLVFTTATGRHVEPRNLNTAFGRLMNRAGVRQIRFHDLRHTCATLLLGRGVSPQGRHGHPRPLADRRDHEHLRPRHPGHAA